MTISATVPAMAWCSMESLALAYLSRAFSSSLIPVGQAVDEADVIGESKVCVHSWYLFHRALAATSWARFGEFGLFAL